MGGNPWDKNPNRLLDNGTGGVRDTYQPDAGSTWSQAEYAEETQREVAAGKRRLLTRIWLAVRRSIWGE
jgi:hypothetical protein